MSQSGSLRNGSGSGSIIEIHGDTGFISGTNVTIYANNAANQAGGTVLFNNSGTISTLHLNDGASNVYIGASSGNNLLNSSNNVGVGVGSLGSISGGPGTAQFNTAIGYGALPLLTTGSNNSILGSCATALISGNRNIIIGTSGDGDNFTTNESNNIILANAGVTGDNNTIRVGRPSGPNQHTKNFQGGITGVTVAGSAPVGIASTGQLSSLGFGTSGQVLTSNGAATSPTWQAAGGGGSTTYFQAYLTSPQTVAGGNTSTTVVFDTAIDNVGGAYNTGTGVFTAPATGYYSFTTTVFFNNLNSLAANTQIILAYTGSVQSLRLVNSGIGGYSGGAQQICNAAWSMPMTAGDTIKIQPFADGAGNYQIYGSALSSGTFNVSSIFSGFRIA